MSTTPNILAPTRAGRVVTSANTWRQNYDPMRWLDIPRAVALLEQERRGVLAEIQWVYELVDQMDPDMIALISLRTSAIKRLKPDVVVADAKTRGFDQALADEQESALREVIDALNIAEAVEDLALATFRGFTVQQILRQPDGTPKALSFLDRWQFSREGYRGAFWWNPDSSACPGTSLPAVNRIGGPELPLSDFVIRTVPLYVDRAAIIIGVRSSTCEKDWDAWCEMYGLNQTVITEPPNAKPDDRPKYDAAARAFSDGQGGTLPNGAVAAWPQATRGTPPFKDRADYLTRKKVLAGTSGMLTMLAEAGSGTLAGGAHQSTFDALADAEAVEISAALNMSVIRPLLAARFPGRPRLAAFGLLRDAIEDQAAASTRIAALAPYFAIDPADASERTGLTLAPLPAAPLPPGALASEASQPAALNAGGTPTGAPPSEEALVTAATAAIREARAADLAPVIDRLLASLESTAPGALEASLKSLYADLPKLLTAAGKSPTSASAISGILEDAVGGGYQAKNQDPAKTPQERAGATPPKPTS